MSIMLNLLAAPVAAAGDDALLGGIDVVMPGDVFGTMFLCNLPLQAVNGLLRSDCPIAPAASAQKKAPAREKKNTSGENGILPGGFGDTVVRQAHEAVPVPVAGSRGGVLRAEPGYLFLPAAFPPGGGFLDALRRYLATISGTALPLSVKTAMQTVHSNPANTAGFFIVKGIHV
jgi:hypothetical protein